MTRTLAPDLEGLKRRPRMVDAWREMQPFAHEHRRVVIVDDDRAIHDDFEELLGRRDDKAPQRDRSASRW